MKLTVEKALEMLENSRGKTKDDHWIDHSICVGNSAGKIAKTVFKKAKKYFRVRSN